MTTVEEVYRRDHERLWRSLVAFTGDPDVATDAEAEAFTQVLARGDAVTDPGAWVWRTAFKVANGMLALKRSGAAPLPISAETGGTLEASTAVFDQSLAEFLDLLQDLSSQQRMVVVLRYAGGLRPTEIADVLDTSAGAVRVQLHRAHDQLRERIDA